MSTSKVSTGRQRNLSEWINVPPVFIVGPPRSGTTLMRLMLTSHPNVSISSEGAYIYRLRSRLGAYGELSQPENLEAMYHDILPLLQSERFLEPPDFEQLYEWVGQFGAEPGNIIKFFGTWEARVLGKSKLSWWGDNAPYHVYHVPFFKALFPDCKFIVMVRDPRDTCASIKNTWHDFNKALMQWELSLRDGLLAEKVLGPEQVKCVRYEELVTAPGKQLRDICEFLGIKYTEVMLAYHQSDAAKAIAQLGHHQNVLRPIFASSIGKYRQILTQEEIATIHHRLYSPMRCLGYISYEEYEQLSCQKS